MTDDGANAYLELTDWRRRVAALFAEWRAAAVRDPEAATMSFREAKDVLLREHPQSPLPVGERAAFGGLPYWPYDPAYRMTLTIDPVGDDGGPHAERRGTAPGGSGLALPSSGPGAIAFRRIGRLTLAGPLEGSALSVFWIEGYGGGIFLPFRDATSGSDTYGAGRYALDTIKSADHGAGTTPGTVVVDFNLAFHPSCAYDPAWSCPLAPPENRLAVRVEAGERLRPSRA